LALSLLHNQNNVNNFTGDKLNIKILFLDVDGVLNTAATTGISVVHIERLKHIVDQTNCKIVLSTSWRVVDDTRRQIIEALYKIGNMDVSNIIIGSTPIFFLNAMIVSQSEQFAS